MLTSMDTLPPVALFLFNRPDLTQQVFGAIRAAQPPRLLLVADGPRRPGEKAACDASRAIAHAVDWECEVLTDFSEVNLGCKRRISSGLDWVFRTCEEAIILEDDCLPSPSFFPYCRDLLDHYRNDARVSLIGGTNLLPGSGTASYSFSRYGSIWGWASWRRAWRAYDVDMKTWPAFRDAGLLRAAFPDPEECRYWTASFDAMYAKSIDTWDYQWFFTRLSQSGLSAVPRVNLVSNLGFRGDATHTGAFNARTANVERGELACIEHPAFVVPDTDADRRLFDHIFRPPSHVGRIIGKLGRMFSQGLALHAREP
jgi:hypothetical protein